MSTKLLPATTGAATGFSPAIEIRGTTPPFIWRTFQAVGVMSTGTAVATVTVQASNDGVNFLDLATISLTMTTTAVTDGFSTGAMWEWYRVSYSIPANGTVTVFMKP